MPMVMSSEQYEWFTRMRGEWLRVMKPFSGLSASQLFPPVALPPPERFEGCIVLLDRFEMLKRLPKGGTGAEIGTQEGRFADAIMDIVQPAELHLFDIDDGPLRARDDSTLLQCPEIALHLGDSSTMLAAFPEDYFDWIYIDGDHSYEGVSRDIRVARTKVKPGGLLMFNDFTLWDPFDCIDYGVPYAVCELSKSFGFTFVYFTLDRYLYNDVALRRPETRIQQIISEMESE